MSIVERKTKRDEDDKQLQLEAEALHRRYSGIEAELNFQKQKTHMVENKVLDPALVGHVYC